MSTNVLTIHSSKDVIHFINTTETQRRTNAWFVVLIALGGTFIDAYDFTSLGIGAVQLRQQFHLSPAQLGSVTAVMGFGALIGALSGGYYTDKIGRLKMFLLDLFLFVFAAIGAALAPNYWVLFAFRFIMGIGVGLDFPVALSFIAEYSSLKQKGGFVNLWQAMWYTAAAVCFAIGIIFYTLGAGPNLWRIAVGFGAVPALVVLLLRYLYMGESPLWEASRGNLKGAAQILSRTYAVRAVVADDAIVESPRHYSLRDFARIFSPRYRARTIMASLVSATQSMEYYAIGFYLPTIALLLFGKDFRTALIGTLIFNLFGIAGGVIQSRLTNRIGIRRLAIVGYCVVIAALLILGGFGAAFPPILGATFIAIFIFGHAFGPGSQGMTLGTLSFPTAIRGAGSGFTQAMLRVGSILGFFFFPLVLAASGLHQTLMILAIVPLIGLIATVLIRWDPTGKDVEAEERDERTPRAEMATAGPA